MSGYANATEKWSTQKEITQKNTRTTKISLMELFKLADEKGTEMKIARLRVESASENIQVAKNKSAPNITLDITAAYLADTYIF